MNCSQQFARRSFIGQGGQRAVADLFVVQRDRDQFREARKDAYDFGIVDVRGLRIDGT